MYALYAFVAYSRQFKELCVILNMEPSIIISIVAIVISIIALIQSFLAHKETIISNTKKELTDRANDCNKFIIHETQGHTNTNQGISAIVTAIIYAKDQLKLVYKNHWLLLLLMIKKILFDFFISNFILLLSN